MSDDDGRESAHEQSSAERAELEKMQPGGGLGPRTLLIIAGVVILIAVAIIIYVLTKTGDVPQDGNSMAVLISGHRLG